jgi:hypothetical protein
MSIREPRLDWCMQDRTTPAMMKTHMILSRTVSARRRALDRRVEGGQRSGQLDAALEAFNEDGQNSM